MTSGFLMEVFFLRKYNLIKNSIFLLGLLFNSVYSLCQARDERKLIHLQDKVFTDTTWSSSYNPDSIFVYYYSVRSKYPESSQTIRANAEGYLMQRGQHFSGSGYLTFRFFIDSAGHVSKRIQVLQTDEFYKDYQFSDKLIWTLCDFLKTLHDWNPAKAPKGYPPFYIHLITFKIHEGRIVNIIP